MTIYAGYFIHASNWFDAQRAYCLVKDSLYQGPSGQWITEKQDGMITAINCDDPKRVTSKDFIAVRDFATQRKEISQTRELQPTRNILPYMYIEVVDPS